MATTTVKERPRKCVRRVHKWDEDKFLPVDWKKLHSYTGVKLFFVLGERTTGKTYGLRLENIENYWKYRTRFVEIVRNTTSLPSFANDYFEKIANQNEFPELTFKTESNRAYVARKVPEGETPDWELCGYFVSLSSEQQLKTMTFDRVRDFTFDETVIDRSKNNRINYLRDEYGLIMGIMNTALREVPGDDKKARLHLIGNACDLTCPMFHSIGMRKVPKFGITFVDKHKRAMVYRLRGKYAKGFREQTTVGQLMSLAEDQDEESRVFFENEFVGEYNPEVMAKPSRARHAFTIRFGRDFGIWFDFKTGLVYVSKNCPNDEKPVYALLRKDGTIDYRVITRRSDTIKMLQRMAREKMLRYESPMLAAQFGELLTYIGIV